MRAFALMIIIALFGMSTAHAQLQKQKKWKVGLNRFSSGVNYKYEANFKENVSDTAYTKISKTSAGNIANTEFMLEYIFFGLMGLEVNFNLTPGVRNFSFNTTNEKIGDIVEEVKSGALYGVNFYFSDHTSPGFKFFAGILTGSFLVTHTFSNGGDRPATLTTDQEALLADNFKAAQTSTITVPVQILKGGMDWIREAVGFRFQVSAIQASETKTSSGLGKTSLAQKQTETVSLSGGATLGIFGHF
ncbi:MAG: hypothetical protein HQM14_09215 [SAR324 cluster bacterium]|nr:hypothetical protein [SAR324 cluster bacterium]